MALLQPAVLHGKLHQGVKQGFSIDRIATGDFQANEIDLLIKLLANNFYERFKLDCGDPVHQRFTIARLRLEFFHCAATLVQHSRQVVLKLAKGFANRYARQIEARVAALE
ncbi:transposase [Paenibacillus sp. 11B]|nr:transposase [Paenibacillus sp. 11B]